MDNEYKEIVSDILKHDKFLELKQYHHHNSSVYDHSLKVSILAYKLAKKFNLDYVSVARGALLHDFFLYDWKIEGERVRKPLFKKHGFTHAKESLKNAKIYFQINKTEEDIIVKHMFPLNIAPPITKESWLVTMVDKYYAIAEYFDKYFK